MGMTRDIFKDKALSLLLGERFIGLPLFDSENIEDYRLSDMQGDMCFEDFLDHFYTLLAVEKWIKAEELENGSGNNLPSVNTQEPKTEWIPVTERLPKEGEEVLVWYEYDRYGDYNCRWQTCGLGWQRNAHFYVDNDGFKPRVIAWCELPKPYSEVEQ